MQRVNDEMWKRHANPWSIWTRFAAIPAFMLAVWSRGFDSSATMAD